MTTPPDFRFCPACATALHTVLADEDGGPRARQRCPACGFTHWNNPLPVLAAVVEYEGRILLARNAAWTHRMFALIAGFLEAGETPEDGVCREVKEETGLEAVAAPTLIGVYPHLRHNEIALCYHVIAHGEIRLSRELSEYRLFAPDAVRCWHAATGYALADWLRGRGYTPEFLGER